MLLADNVAMMKCEMCESVSLVCVGLVALVGIRGELGGFCG